MDARALDPLYDIAIIGGGINGCGIARDAAGRGASVVLLEQGDFAGATSSASTKLIHGGLRYLEHYEFRLVREALMEREVLWGIAPHIIRPLRFVLPHHKGLRPAWLLRLGLFLYDHLGGRKRLPATRTLDLRHDEAGAPLRAGYARAFEYSDCWVEDSRLVVLNALDAAERGADIRPRSRVTGAVRAADHWQIEVEPPGGGREIVRARVLVNAAGPWVHEVLAQVLRINTPANVRLVQGSHIVVPRLYQHDRAYIFQNGDGRIVFAIPYEHDFTLIGTTDRDFGRVPGKPVASPEEIAYLCAAASEYFRTPVTPDTVVWTYSGVRPLYDDGASKAQEATRDYVLELEGGEGEGGSPPSGRPPLLSVFGGKITTYRRLAEHALQKLGPFLPTLSRASWTGGEPLPGGDFPVDGQMRIVAQLKRAHPFLEERQARRLVVAYGTRALRLLDGARSAADLGRTFGADLTEAEVLYLMREEWARTAEDVLWRRSKLGLRFTREQVEALDAFMQASMMRQPQVSAARGRAS
ncbi:glycerol-3-phosphate dehydrogenase [Ancylobacter amanitiformis]|uniref:Glycerol-3-phosphate dehydrogenase n=1 Tax=Ancylobacter amanitiformis TaxID=217069 RepID=A0ABU0LU22_9HYPH|nr:glycerol-3-phosphate dehydrogenase [Ancylobacter amanitiformis]MDQ0512178.1 glycerol-3-phosphate dehydrogenase [Ancylobacter amanitiformis]